MQNDQIQKRILQAVASLAKYELHVWEKVGPSAQLALLHSIGALSPEQRNQDRALVLTVCQSVLSPEIEGTDWNANSVTLRTGAIPAIPEIIRIRGTAIAILFELFKAANNDAERREVYRALREAGHTSGRAETRDEFLKLTLENSKQIVEFLSNDAGALSYELMQTIEHDFWYDFKRARDITLSPARAGCHEAATQLMAAIEGLRDKLNKDPTFVKFKVLFGFESVFAYQWSERDEDKATDYNASEKRRADQSAAYVDTITDENEAEWLSLIERIASIQSNDMAMFPSFARFLTQLGSAKPLVAVRLLSQASDNVASFLPAILAGLHKSNDSQLYEEQIERLLKNGAYLAALARHLRVVRPEAVELGERTLRRAIEAENSVAVAEFLIMAMESKDEGPAPSQLFEPAIRYLNSKEVYWWVRAAWMARDAAPFFASMSGAQAALLLPALIHVSKLDYTGEQILIQIAKHHLPLVWDCFESRLSSKANTDRTEEHYEAIPYKFHGLEQQLMKDPKLAVQFGRRLFKQDSTLFRFRGGRLLSAAFPMCPPAFANELSELASQGTREDIEFILAVLENYHGEETTHEVLKRIVVRFPDDQRVRTGVVISIESTGVVWGEFGFANALRDKLAIVRTWQEDARPEVQAFADAHVKSLELRIVEEQRRAEEQKALRELEYDEPDKSDKK